MEKPLAKISEGTGDDIAIKISIKTGAQISGKTLYKYTEAVLKGESQTINPQLPNLHRLAEYVMRSKNIQINTEKRKDYPYWFDYEAMVSSMPERKPNEETIPIDFKPEQSHNNVKPVSIHPEPEENNAHGDMEPKEQSAKKPGGLFADKTVFDNSSFLKAGIFGGACAGFVGVLLVAALRYFSSDMPFIATGYESISKAFFFQKVFPILFLFQIAGGAFLGWFCCYYALKRAAVLKNILFFLTVFLLMFLLRQTTVRNSWMPVGEHVYLDKKGNKVILSGGPLGEPDFEALAVAFMGAVVFLILTDYLRKKVVHAIPLKNTWNVLLLVTIPGVCAWCLAYLIFKLLTHFGVIRENDFWISKAIFYYRFPHADRVLLMILLCWVYVYTILVSIRLQTNKTISKK
ncbi:MAG TPA: hypothetical protein VFW07_09400 [Parafilimonas sp.]|nr:hypothetical protein [Parafilimonas sp.]